MKGDSVSTESRQRTRIFRKALRDIEFICRQILRFSKMSPEQLVKHMAKRKEDAFCTLPHHSGRGHLVYGHEASQRFDTLGNLVLYYEPYLAGRVNSEIIREKIVDAFVQRVLRENGGVGYRHGGNDPQGCKRSLQGVFGHQRVFPALRLVSSWRAKRIQNRSHNVRTTSDFFPFSAGNV